MLSPFRIITALCLLLTAVTLLSLRQEVHPAQQIKERLVIQADRLNNAVAHLQQIPLTTANSKRLQQQFRTVRLAYKRLEWAAEYFDPLTAKLVNGPPVPETEQSGLVIEPQGLQMIEQYLFPALNFTKRAKLQTLLTTLQGNTLEFRAFFQKAELQDWQILDAAKLEVFHVEALGLNDFDDPLLKNCFAESAAALGSVRGVIELYAEVPEFNAAISVLQNARAFNKFNRATYLRNYANPLSKAIAGLKHRLQLPDVRYNRLLNQDAATLFEPGAFNRNAYTAAPVDSATADKIALGKQLFFDPQLSGSGKRSCASCHQPEKAFTDGLVKNRDISGKKSIARNTPTLINAALQPAQFYDMRAPSLEDQALDVMQNKDEMHGDMHVAVRQLWKDEHYRTLFSKAYPQNGRAAIDTFEVMNALASYIRSLTSLNSRFDDYMRGADRAMDQQEILGFNLFMGKAKCGTCHYLPLFSGVLPPRYMQTEAEVIGVPRQKSSRLIDNDRGLYNVQPQEFNRYAFKITSVRNTALTAPYMHNGVFKTMEEVIDFYDRGGGAGQHIRVPNQTLDAAPLHLTTSEKKALIAFIKTLDNR